MDSYKMIAATHTLYKHTISAYAFLATEKKVDRFGSLSKAAISRKVLSNAAFSCLASSMDGLSGEPQGSRIRFLRLPTRSVPFTSLVAGVWILNLNESEYDMNQSIGTSAPTVFNFQSHEVRTVTRNGEVWFVAVDVCNALGYQNTSKAIGDHLDDDERANESLGLAGSPVNIINESGLYALVLRSRKPEARKFAKWVTSEVLPTIRKTGKYESKPTQAAISLQATQRILLEMVNGQVTNSTVLASNIVLVNPESKDSILEFLDKMPVRYSAVSMLMLSTRIAAAYKLPMLGGSD